MSLDKNILHYVLLVYNFISLVLGILAIIACVFELDNFSQDVAQYTEDIVQLVAACMLVISAFIGAAGVTFNSMYTLGIFLTQMIFLILTHIWKLLRYDEIQLEDAIRSEVTYAWLLAIDKHPESLDQLQQKYECCGKEHVSDYLTLNMEPRKSCFSDENATIHGDKFYVGGCVLAMQKYCLEMYRIEKLVHLIMLGYEIIGVALTSLFIWQLFSRTRRYFY